ncbi:MAG: PDZ domain-containing protein [Planctomycetota bacterium]|jgi:S1-C subfamily serine protease
MAVKAERTFSGIVGQSVVVCLLVVFVAVAVVAMFATVGGNDEVVWIGMTARALDAETAAALGIPHGMGGVVVGEVDGIAQKAGVRHGDVVLGVNGEPIRGMADFAQLVRRADLPGQGAQLDIIRGGARMPVFVLPPGEPARLPPPVVTQGAAGAPAVMDRRWLGVDAETFAAGEGRALGIPAGVGGVLIDGVARGSMAEQAGLNSNDVIVSLNGQKIDTAADLWGILADLNRGDAVELGIYRDGRLLSVALSTASGALVGGFPATRAAGRTAAPAWNGRGRMGGWGLGPGGFLVCPGCGTRVARPRGVPGYSVPCPSCGTLMVRGL